MSNYIKPKDRCQVMMFPPSIESLVPSDHPSRVVDSFVESLDFGNFTLKEANDNCGRPRYNPKVLIKLLLYGYSINMRSSRALERLTYENISIIWLTGNSHPDFCTIARFRSDNLDMMKELLKHTIRLYMKMSLRFEPVIYVDGTKILANASDRATVDKEGIQKLESMAEKILQEAEELDSNEDNQLGKDNSGNRVNKEILSHLREKIEEYKQEFAKRGKYNSTDPDAKFMLDKKRLHTSYNAQISVDENGVILEADVTNKSTDNSQLKDRVEKTETNVGKPIDKVIADCGFFEHSQVKDLLEKGKEVIVKSAVKVGKERGKQTDKFEEKDFIYQEENDSYTCPNNKELKFRKERENRNKLYRIYSTKVKDCLACELHCQCCRSKGRRELWVSGNKEFNKNYRKIWESRENQELYKKRKYKVEPVFGIIKSVFNFRRCTLRGLHKVKGEWSLIATVYNLMKLSKLGKTPFMPKTERQKVYLCYNF